MINERIIAVEQGIQRAGVVDRRIIFQIPMAEVHISAAAGIHGIVKVAADGRIIIAVNGRLKYIFNVGSFQIYPSPKSPALNQRKLSTSPTIYLRWPTVTILGGVDGAVAQEPVLGRSINTGSGRADAIRGRGRAADLDLILLAARGIAGTTNE